MYAPWVVAVHGVEQETFEVDLIVDFVLRVVEILDFADSLDLLQEHDSLARPFQAGWDLTSIPRALVRSSELAAVF